MEHILVRKLLELSEDEALDLLHKIRSEDADLYELLVTILQEL